MAKDSGSVFSDSPREQEWRPRGPEPKVGEPWPPKDRRPDSDRQPPATEVRRGRGPEPRPDEYGTPRLERSPVDPPGIEKVDLKFPRVYDRSDCREPAEVELFRPPHEWVNDRNPGGMGKPGRSQNCGDCARAAELTWRGIDTQAGALADPEAGGESTEIMDYWSPGDRVQSDFGDIQQTLDKLGPGASALVMVWWNEGDGHAFNAFNEDDGVTAVDGQKGLTGGWPPTMANIQLRVHKVVDVEAIFVDSSGRHLTIDDLGRLS